MERFLGYRRQDEIIRTPRRETRTSEETEFVSNQKLDRAQQKSDRLRKEIERWETGNGTLAVSELEAALRYRSVRPRPIRGGGPKAHRRTLP